MSGSPETFSPDWLALREPADHRARAADLLPPLCAAWRTAGWRRVLDLGSGAGSNLRYLAPRLPDGQDWTLLDHDADLLARAASAAEQVQQATYLRGDLAREGIAAVADAHLVTCSALLDLVGAAWLHRLARACSAASCGVLLALTYDGTMHWDADSTAQAGSADPDAADDALIQRLVNAHQRRAQHPEPALGPDAAPTAEALLAAEGYRTWRSPSPWRLGPPDAVLANELVAGWERAALELAAGDQEACRIRAWSARRRLAITSGRFRLIVGHQDLLALPPARG